MFPVARGTVPIIVDEWDDTAWALGAASLVLHAPFATPLHEHPSVELIRARLDGGLRATAVARQPGPAVIGPTGWRKALVVTMFLAPSLFALLAFSIGPMVGTLWVSLQEWNLIRPAEFIGLDNFRELWHDDDFRRALRNTLYYLVGYLPLVIVGGLALAVLVNRKLRGVDLFRGRLLPAGRHELGRRVAAVEVAAQPQRRPRQLAARRASASTAPAGGPTARGRCRR